MQKKKNITSPSTTQHHDTPNNKTHFIKFRVTEIEKRELEHTAKLLNLSLSTLIRRALHNVKIEKKIIAASNGEETLTAVSTLLETVKDILRKQISSVLYRATSFEEFSDRLIPAVRYHCQGKSRMPKLSALWQNEVHPSETSRRQL